MSERPIPFVPNEYYHVYNRGNSKQLILYRTHSDYLRFMQLLYLSNGTKSFKIRELSTQDPFMIDMGEKLVAIGAYCLMPNHFHILLKPIIEGGVSVFMKKLSTGYSMYFNKRYERTGGLFEGRYKSQHANTDEYLKYLFSYIHLNPLKLIQSDWKEVGLANISGGEKYLNEYYFSSYRDFLNRSRPESEILDVNNFPEYFPDTSSFVREIQEWVRFNE